MGADERQVGSWIGVLCVLMGALTVGFSLYHRKPVMVAWSTPGAALLITSLVDVPPAQAVGAFMFCGLLIFLCGVTRAFERVMDRLPLALASALLAGVLARFALDAVRAGQDQVWLVLGMLAAYLITKRWSPRYAVLAVLAAGIAPAMALGLTRFESVQWSLAQPVWVTPSFDGAVMLSVGVPLFLVTMASQNLPGVAAMRTAGYDTPVSGVISSTGLAGMLFAPLGCYALNLSAITAAICMSSEAHPDKDQRYWAAVACGVIYLLVGLVGGSVAALLAALPKALILAVAGIALLGTIGHGLRVATQEESTREAALLTFLVTLSGVTFMGIGSAFWAVVVGAVVYLMRAPGPLHR